MFVCYLVVSNTLSSVIEKSLTLFCLCENILFIEKTHIRKTLELWSISFCHRSKIFSFMSQVVYGMLLIVYLHEKIRSVMAMVKAYQDVGVLQADGRLMVNGSLVRSKAPRRVAFKFLDDSTAELVSDTPGISTERREKLAAIRHALNNAAEAENELGDSDWDELTNIRSRTNAGCFFNVAAPPREV